MPLPTKEDRLAELRKKYDAWPDGVTDHLEITNLTILINFAEICAIEACLDQQNPDILEDAGWEITKQFASDLWAEGGKKRILAKELLRVHLGITAREAGLR